MFLMSVLRKQLRTRLATITRLGGGALAKCDSGEIRPISRRFGSSSTRYTINDVPTTWMTTTTTILRLRRRRCVRERRPIRPRDYAAAAAGESYKTHSAPARPVSVRHWIRRSFKDHSRNSRRSVFHSAPTRVLYAAESVGFYRLLFFDFSAQV